MNANDIPYQIPYGGRIIAYTRGLRVSAQRGVCAPIAGDRARQGGLGGAGHDRNQPLPCLA